MRVAQRKKELREKYYFDCQCEACTWYKIQLHAWSISILATFSQSRSPRSNPSLVLAEAAMEGLSCQRCDTGALAEIAGDPSYVCCHCQARLSGKQLCEVLEVLCIAKT